jgi:hypothetical protein
MSSCLIRLVTVTYISPYKRPASKRDAGKFRSQEYPARGDPIRNTRLRVGFFFAQTSTWIDAIKRPRPGLREYLLENMT